MTRAPLALLVLLGLAAPAAAAEPLRYTLRFPAPQTQRFEVEARIPCAGRDETEVMLPVWIPGSYLVREYARHVEGLRAEDPRGRPLSCVKVTKNRWRITSRGLTELRLRYSVYARDMSVRGNWVEDGFAMINGAPTFITLADDAPRPHEVTVALPPQWATVASPLAERPGLTGFTAPDYDALVDSPFVCGNPDIQAFEVSGKPHWLVTIGAGEVWDTRRSAEDLARIVAAQHRFWGEVPYERYIFFNMLTETGGGLEHRNSTLMMTSRWRARDPRGYQSWLGLASHEFFHTWNIKRLRPLALGPFDYEAENLTRSLWVVEGITSYYTNLLLARAGLIDEAAWLQGLSSTIARLQQTPGRLSRSLELSSFDAWIKFYRSDEDSHNTDISYYTKGAVVGFLLDAEIRSASDGARSLDDVMRAAYAAFSGARGYRPEDFERLASEVAGRGLSAFFERALRSTEELDYGPALAWFGLRFSPAPTPREVAWIGLETRDDGGRLRVRRVTRGTPAYDLGLNVDDEVLALSGYRIATREDWDARRQQLRPGDAGELLIARRGELMTLAIRFGQEPTASWSLVAARSEALDGRRRAWLASGPLVLR